MLSFSSCRASQRRAIPSWKQAQRHLMEQVLQELKSKNALSLAYLKVPSEEMEAQNDESMQQGY